MAQREQIDLIMLNDGNSIEVFSFLNGFPFDDNGGEPDGDIWLTPEDFLSEKEIDSLIEMYLAKRIRGWKVEPYTEPNNYNSWCGYTSRNEAYTLYEDDAIAIQNDEQSIEDCN